MAVEDFLDLGRSQFPTLHSQFLLLRKFQTHARLTRACFLPRTSIFLRFVLKKDKQTTADLTVLRERRKGET
jgi:hypothetical protein